MNLKPLICVVAVACAMAWAGGVACDIATGVTNIGKCKDIAPGASETLDDESLTGNCHVRGTLVIRNQASVTGNIVAEAGSTVVIQDSTVLGNVDSTDGAALTLTRAKVTGNVVARGTDAVKVTQTEVTGNLSLSDFTSCEVEANSATNPSVEGCTAPAAP
jgi:hypothetical protein